MTDYRPLCKPCNTRMKCVENGHSIDYGYSSKQHGDLYECPSCGYGIVTGFGRPFYVGDRQ